MSFIARMKQMWWGGQSTTVSPLRDAAKGFDQEEDGVDGDEEFGTPGHVKADYDGYTLEPEGGYWIVDNEWYVMYEGGTPVFTWGFVSLDEAFERATEAMREDIAGVYRPQRLPVDSPPFIGPELGWKESEAMCAVYSGKHLRQYWEAQLPEQQITQVRMNSENDHKMWEAFISQGANKESFIQLMRTNALNEVKRVESGISHL